MTNTTIERAPLRLDEYEPEKYWYLVYSNGRCIKRSSERRWGASVTVVTCYTDTALATPFTNITGLPYHWRQSSLLAIIDHAKSEPRAIYSGYPVIGVSIDESPQVIPL